MTELTAVFWFKLLQSFLAGSIWVTVTTLIAERYGSRVGGFIGGLPSTIILALFFIGITQSASAAVAATTVVPLMMGFNGIFMVVYLMNLKHGFGPGLGSALAVWVILAGFLVMVNVNSFILSVTVWIILIVLCYLAVEKFARIPAHGKIQVHYTFNQILFRGLFAGILIAFAVFMSKIGGPLLGGIFAVFPAIFISTIVITYRSGGRDFSRAVVKTLTLSGMINVGLYAIAVRYYYAWQGLAVGTMMAIITAMILSYAVFKILR